MSAHLLDPLDRILAIRILLTELLQLLNPGQAGRVRRGANEHVREEAVEEQHAWMCGLPASSTAGVTQSKERSRGDVVLLLGER